MIDRRRRKEFEEIHVLVNGRLTEALREIKALKKALKKALDEANKRSLPPR